MILAAAVCGCGGGETQQEQESENTDTADDGQIKIGVSFDSFIIERWLRDRDVFVSTAKELGASVNVQNASGSVSEQISQIRYLIKKDVDVLVIIAVDCDTLSGVVAEAKEAGIPVISYDRLLMNSGSDLYVSFDNTAVGTLMAQTLKAAIPDGGEIAMIQGPEEDNNVKMVRNGFETEIEDSNLSVVYQGNCAGWLAEEAVDQVETILEDYPDIQGIMCGNDDIASQVVRTLTEHRLAGKVKVVGQDGDLAACQRIVEGTQEMTAFKSVDMLAKAAAEFAVGMAEGTSPEQVGSSDGDDTGETLTYITSPRINSIIDDGTEEIPFCMLNPIAVTKDNMDEIIIDGGYHSREDVYLNVAQDSAD